MCHQFVISITFNEKLCVPFHNINTRLDTILDIYVIYATLLYKHSIPSLLMFSGPLLMICLVIAGAAAGPFVPVSTAMPVEMPAIGPVLAGTALGILFMIGNTGGFFGPIIAGWLMDTTGSAWSGFMFAALLLLIAPLFLIKLRNYQVSQGAQN